MVVSGGATRFSRNGDLAMQHSSNPFKRHKINAETVSEWEELDPRQGVVGAMGQAATRAALPGVVGKAVGQAWCGLRLGTHCARRLGRREAVDHRVPQRQFIVLSILLKDLQITTELSARPEADVPPGVASKIAGLASSVLPKGRQKSAIAEDVPVPDATEQIAKLASFHAQGIPHGRGVLGQEGRTPQAPLARRASPTRG
jgi:hypothetical protein